MQTRSLPERLLAISIAALMSLSTACFPRAHGSQTSLEAANRPVRVRVRAPEGGASRLTSEETVGYEHSTRTRIGGYDDDSSLLGSQLVPISLRRALCDLPCEVTLPRDVSASSFITWLETADGWRGDLRSSTPLVDGREYSLTRVSTAPRVLITVGVTLAAVAGGIGLAYWGFHEDRSIAGYVLGGTGAITAMISLPVGIIMAVIFGQRYAAVTEAS